MKNKIIILMLFICSISFAQPVVKKITELPDVTSVGDNSLFISTGTTATDKLYKTTGAKIKTYIGVNATIADSLNALRNGIGYYVRNTSNSKSAKLINVVDTNSRPILYVNNDTTVITNKLKLGNISGALPNSEGNFISQLSGVSNALGIYSYGGNSSGIRMGLSGGTILSPTSTPINALMSFVGGHVYDGSNWTTSVKIGMFLRTTETQTPSAQGNKITFETTANGSTTRLERMVIKDTVIVTAPFVIKNAIGVVTATIDIDGYIKKNYIHGNTFKNGLSVNLTITNVNQWYKLLPTMPSTGTHIYFNGLTFAGDSCTITKAGDYKGSFSIDQSGGTNNEEYEVGVFLNGFATYLRGGTWTTGSILPHTIDFYFDDLSLGDDISFWVRNITNATDTYIIRGAAFNIERLDE